MGSDARLHVELSRDPVRLRGGESGDPGAVRGRQLLPAGRGCLPYGGRPPVRVARLREQGFAMVRLFPEVHGYTVDSAACATVEALDGMGMPVMLPTVEAEPTRTPTCSGAGRALSYSVGTATTCWATCWPWRVAALRLRRERATY